ncbi:MAG: proteasome accessory factor PafA2 family protein [Gemmatimonadetes bacterium]|nr:proteasome accessory factor PafA2 family protein [Gemmatimonadota bacterium]
MSDRLRVPKLTGADVELGNFIEGDPRAASTAPVAARLVIAAIRARLGLAPPAGTTLDGGKNPHDHDRVFLGTLNSGCYYIDADHAEGCLPETLSAWDHVAWWQAMLRIAQRARDDVNAMLPTGQVLQLLADNSDGVVSYGAHLNVLVSRPTWEDIAHRKAHHAAFLAAFQVSSIVITGAGKVGADNSAAAVHFQLAQRADWFESMTGPQTTYHRPLVNTRDEPLCGRGTRATPARARLHCIFFDTTLSQVATLLRVGMMQLVLAMMEGGHIDVALTLDDPLGAVRAWSHDVTLTATARGMDGQELTALEMQRRFWEMAQRFVASGEAAEIVPRAEELVALWDETLCLLERRDWAALARRLDWVLKLGCIERALASDPSLAWDSPEVRLLAHQYASLDVERGLYWHFARAGLLDEVATEEQVRHAVSHPPTDTRAHLRGQLQRRFGHAVERVDWDHIVVRLSDRDGTTSSWRVDLPDPLDNGCAALARSAAPHGDIASLLQELGAVREAPAVAVKWRVAPGDVARIVAAVAGEIDHGDY